MHCFYGSVMIKHLLIYKEEISSFKKNSTNKIVYRYTVVLLITTFDTFFLCKYPKRG